MPRTSIVAGTGLPPFLRIIPSEGRKYLTHLYLDKMAAIFTDENLKCIFLSENDGIPIRISLKVVPRSLSDNILAFV